MWAAIQSDGKKPQPCLYSSCQTTLVFRGKEGAYNGVITERSPVSSAVYIAMEPKEIARVNSPRPTLGTNSFHTSMVNASNAHWTSGNIMRFMVFAQSDVPKLQSTVSMPSMRNEKEKILNMPLKS